MATVLVTLEDVQTADAFLTAYASDKVPTADFSEGSAVRDFVIKAIAYIFAFIRQEQTTTRNYQSLLSLSKLPASTDVDEAVDALLSNWFITRNSGRLSHIAVLLHFSKAADVVLTPTLRFFRTADLIFTPDVAGETVIPASDLRATVSANGSITDYVTTVMMLSATTNVAYNIDPGRFVTTDAFSPYFLYAENQAKGYDGASIETTESLLARAPTALSVRNLINSRSIDTTLRNTYSNLTKTVSIGYGDPEMIRDMAAENATRLAMHTGGCNDAYLNLPRTVVVENGLTVGGEYLRPDNVINMLKDAVVDFLATGVRVNDILRVTVGLPTVPAEYVIIEVRQHALLVRERYPFVTATAENDPPTYVSYVIDSKVTSTTGATSRIYQQPGSVVLSGRPHYRIKEVLFTPTGGSATPLARVNDSPNATQYCVIGSVPSKAQSALAMDVIQVAAANYSGALKVTYETLAGYEDIQGQLTDRFERVLCANPLAKALHPIYLSLNFTFRAATNATGATDTVALAAGISDFINGLDSANLIDLSEILQYVRDSFPNIGLIRDPIILTYDLYAPDGQLYKYVTKDLVTLFPMNTANTAHLTNGATLRVPILNADVDPTLGSNAALFAAANTQLSEQLVALGVSDRVVRYITDPDLITVTEMD